MCDQRQVHGVEVVGNGGGRLFHVILKENIVTSWLAVRWDCVRRSKMRREKEGHSSVTAPPARDGNDVVPIPTARPEH